MGTPQLLICCLLILCLAVLADAAVDPKFQSYISKECAYTTFPNLCVQSLSGLGSESGHVDILFALINKTIKETTELPEQVTSSNLMASEAQTTQTPTGYCHELMQMSLRRLNQALSAIKESPRRNKDDIQTWLSAVLTFQQDCKDSVHETNGISKEAIDRISEKMDYLSRQSSNQLALVDRINSSTGLKDRRLDEEQGYPRWVSKEERSVLEREAVTANVVVAKDGSGHFRTISEAIRAASGRRFVIYVKKGVYSERIETNKDGITLIGDGKYSTLIVADNSVARGASLKGSATFAVFGDGFIARDIGFQNTAGPEGKQAVALMVGSDHSVFYRCSIAGYQDTLFAFSLRQFYRECDIYGTIDYIFGNAAAVFQNCQLLLRRPRPGGYNVILANGRTDPRQNTGFAVQNCRIAAASDLYPVRYSVRSYLGRPWKAYSRAVVMQSSIDEAISPRGWIEWEGADSSFLRTLYFAEYANAGPRSGPSDRVRWPGFHLIGKDDAGKFTVGNFIGGTSWVHSAGVPFVAGL